jgi:hypothetical protein
MRMSLNFDFEAIKSYDGILLDAKKSSKRSPKATCKGQVVIVSINRQMLSLHSASYDLPKEIRAVSPNEVDTVVAIQQARVMDQKRVGSSGARSTEMKTISTLTFLDLKSKTITGFVKSDKPLNSEEISKIVVDAGLSSL